jgi:CubicO group peptidase (beta-lactamase class C family)
MFSAAHGPPDATVRDASVWGERLAELAARYRVPGATLGILSDGSITTTGTGVLSKATRVEVTPDSLFQIGSITKVWTATLVMQLVDEGLLDLDAPVAEVLPGFRVADLDVTRSMTTRHLVTHTSGIDGDVFSDTGRGDDCIERYVAGMAELAQNHPLGATWSYCNSGYVLAGRLVEHLTGTTWDAALRERLARPLGLTRTVTLPEDALLHRTAVGHVGEPDDDPVPATSWALSRSMGPAGMVTASVEDVLSLARMHLEAGVAADGTRMLGCQRRGDGDEGGRPARHAHARRLVGARLDPLRLGRRAPGRSPTSSPSPCTSSRSSRSSPVSSCCARRVSRPGRP